MTESASPRLCPLCGTTGKLAYLENIDPALFSDFTYASRKRPEGMHFELQKCQGCNLLFTSTLPDYSELINAYCLAAFDAGLMSEFAARTYAREIYPHINHSVDSLLDVGCGHGAFMRQSLLSGVSKVFGIEPSTAAAGSGGHEIQNNIATCSIEEFETNEKFDLVTLFQTIEHIREPLGFMQKTRDLLSSNGLVAIACHDFKAPVNMMMRQKSPIFDIEHLQIFSIRSITKLLEMNNFEVVKISHYANTYPISYWLRLAPLPSRLKNLVDRNGRLAGIAVRIPVGNIMAIGRKR